MDGISLKTTRINESREVLNAFSGVDVKVNYYWDNHGKLINWNKHTEAPKAWTSVDARIEAYSFTEVLVNSSHDFKTVQLYVANQLVPGELTQCIIKVDGKGKSTLHCKVTVGWG